MGSHSKRLKSAYENIDRKAVYELAEAVKKIKAAASAKFDETVEIARSEEHTSELQTLMRTSYAVFCLKKQKWKKKHIQNQTHQHNKIKYHTKTCITNRIYNSTRI